MSRQPRIVLPGVALHITQRGNDRVRTFHDDSDHARYCETLAEISQEVGCAIHAWVLMLNHIHLLATPSSPSAPALLMRRVGVRYVRFINTKYARTGTLWEGRFRSAVVISRRYLMACARYIELNPVRAGLVRDPASFRWSSYRHNALGVPDAIITPHEEYLRLGDSTQVRHAEWAAFCANAQSDDLTEDIRKAVRATRAPIDARDGTEFAHAPHQSMMAGSQHLGGRSLNHVNS